MKTLLNNFLIIASMTLISFSCDKDQDLVTTPADFTDDFESGNDGWIAAFADYSTATDSFNFMSGVSALPSPLDTAKQGFMIGANNLSDDLFMFLKKQLTGLQPNTLYNLSLTLKIASDAPSNFVGIGGPPGEAVVVKIGATTAEPVVMLDTNYYQLNIDKGGNSTSGADMDVIGNIATGLDTTQYEMITRQGTVSANSDSAGSLWLIVGTESGFEGRTVLYYDEIEVDFQ